MSSLLLLIAIMLPSLAHCPPPPVECHNWQIERFADNSTVPRVMPPLDQSFCATGVCFTKLVRNQAFRKITMKLGCNDKEIPIDFTYFCDEPDSTKLTLNCYCKAIPGKLCNGVPMFSLTGDVAQRRRSKMLREVGMFQEGSHIFFDNNFGKTTATTTAATTVVSEASNMTSAPTARPPIQLPEDDPHWRELEGSATGLSLIFAVIVSILRLI